MYKELNGFLKRLEKEGELIRVKDTISTKWEMAAATRIIAKHTGAAVLFEKVKGYSTPVVCNLLGRRSRLALALGVTEKNLAKIYLERRKKLIKPKIIASAPVQQVVIDKDVDISKTIP